MHRSSNLRDAPRMRSIPELGQTKSHARYRLGTFWVIQVSQTGIPGLEHIDEDFRYFIESILYEKPDDRPKIH